MGGGDLGEGLCVSEAYFSLHFLFNILDLATPRENLSLGICRQPSPSSTHSDQGIHFYSQTHSSTHSDQDIHFYSQTHSSTHYGHSFLLTDSLIHTFWSGHSFLLTDSLIHTFWSGHSFLLKDSLIHTFWSGHSFLLTDSLIHTFWSGHSFLIDSLIHTFWSGHSFLLTDSLIHTFWSGHSFLLTDSLIHTFWSGHSFSLTESLDTIDCMNGQQMPRWYFAHEQDDLNIESVHFVLFHLMWSIWCLSELFKGVQGILWCKIIKTVLNNYHHSTAAMWNVLKMYPVTPQRTCKHWDSIVSMSIQHHDVVSTLMRCCINVMCQFGQFFWFFFVYSKPLQVL